MSIELWIGVFIFGSILVIYIFCLVVSANERKTIQKILEKEFPDSKIYLSTHDESFVAVDFSNKQIIVGLWSTRFSSLGMEGPYEKRFPFSAIVKVEIIKDGAQISSMNRGSQALGAAVGGLALGGVGAIIGGLSGSSTTANTIKRISLKITVDDTDKPIYEVLFFKAIEPKGVALSEKLFNEVNTFAAHLEKAIRTA